MSGGAPIERLSALAGLITVYRDAWGNPRQVPIETQRALLAAMGILADSEDAVAASTREIEEAPWRQPLDPVLVTPQPRGNGLRVPLTLSASFVDHMIEWRFAHEKGRIYRGTVRFGDLPFLEGRRLDGDTLERRALQIPLTVGPGHHRLRIFASEIGSTDGGEGISLPVTVFPKRCYIPRRARNGGRAWSIATQLYGHRSARNWGIGNFTDLAQLVRAAARLGADALGLNPLHALFPGNPERISPYSPSDRHFLNSLYIDVEAVADFAECVAARELLSRPETRRRLDAARDATLVDYPEVAALKLQALELLFNSFRKRHLGDTTSGAASERGASFRRFQEVGGEILGRVALFQVLSEYFGPDRSWETWSEPYRDCTSQETASFSAAHPARVEFFQYLQWQAELQLRAASQVGRDSGMSIGLFHDLALAADRAGAETWINRRVIAQDVSLGAPPDEWNHHGQNWGLPAYNPNALRAEAYAPFAAILRANMSRGGALRIDHVMALERTYWIPKGADPRDGGYVRSPVVDLIGVLALESVRQKCLVIGEDLGTLPDGFSERINAAGIQSYRLLYFTKDTRGDFLAPQRYPSSALVAIGTHDLATFRGFWLGRDLDVRTELGLYVSAESDRAARVRRAQERRGLIKAFKREALLPDSFPDETEDFTFDLLVAAYRFLARSPARLLTLHLADAIGEENQVNVPGTVDAYPNWRRKTPIDLAEIENHPWMRALAVAIREERHGGRQLRRAWAND